MNPEKYRFVCLWRYILSGLSRYFVQNVNFVRFLQFFDIILVATPLYTKNHLVVDTKWIQFESTRHCMTPYINYVSGILLYFLVIANILNAVFIIIALSPMVLCNIFVIWWVIKMKTIFSLLMPKQATDYIEEGISLRNVLERFKYHKFSVVPVIDKEGKYKGTLSEGDLLRYIVELPNFNIWN